MRASPDRFEFTPPPAPGLVRSLGLAVLAHAVLLAALTLGVQWKRDDLTVTAEAEIWSAVPQQAAAPLAEPPVTAPAPLPVPLPVPPPLVQRAPTPQAELQPAPEAPEVDIALAREKERLKKRQEQEKRELDQRRQEKQALEKQQLEKQKLEKQKQEKLEKQRLETLRQEKIKEAKLKQDRQLAQKRLEEKRLEEKKREQEQAEAQKKAAQEAKQLQAQRQANLQRMAGLAGATGTAGASGTAVQSAGPSASYAGRIRASIKPNIVFTDDITGNPMAEVEVRTSPDGTIISRKLSTPSGVKSWDDAVLKAIDKTAKLPQDVDGRVPAALEIRFRPRD